VVVEDERGKALNEFRVLQLNADDIASAPQQRNLPLLVAADRHRLPQVAVSQHGDLKADVRSEWSVAGRRRVAALDLGACGVRRGRWRWLRGEVVERDVDALTRLRLDDPRAHRATGASILGQPARQITTGLGRRFDRRLSTVTRRPITSLDCVTTNHEYGQISQYSRRATDKLWWPGFS